MIHFIGKFGKLPKITPNLGRIPINPSRLGNSRATDKIASDLGRGYYLTKMVGNTGKQLPVLNAEGRELIHVVQDGQDPRGMHFYRSFVGRGGKKQGMWYPTLGIIATNMKPYNHEWLPKGSLEDLETGYQRPDLYNAQRAINELLPHDDKDVEDFFRSLGIDSFGINAESAYNFDMSKNFPNMKTKESQQSAILDNWKQKRLNPTWGTRQPSWYSNI